MPKRRGLRKRGRFSSLAARRPAQPAHSARASRPASWRWSKSWHLCQACPRTCLTAIPARIPIEQKNFHHGRGWLEKGSRRGLHSAAEAAEDYPKIGRGWWKRVSTKNRISRFGLLEDGDRCKELDGMLCGGGGGKYT